MKLTLLIEWILHIQGEINSEERCTWDSIKDQRRNFEDNKWNTLTNRRNKKWNLKEIPWRVRKKRKECMKLTNILRNNGIAYSWLLPEGIFFTYKEKWYKINSTFKAEEFLKTHGEELEVEEEETNYRGPARSTTGGNGKTTKIRKTGKTTTAQMFTRLQLKNKDDNKTQTKDG